MTVQMIVCNHIMHRAWSMPIICFFIPSFLQQLFPQELCCLYSFYVCCKNIYLFIRLHMWRSGRIPYLSVFWLYMPLCLSVTYHDPVIWSYLRIYSWLAELFTVNITHDSSILHILLSTLSSIVYHE
jgi:hypothetical protein